MVHPTKFSLQLLGGFRLSDRAGADIELPTKQARALLSYLALSAGRPFRDRVATVIWENRELEQARHSLTDALRALRQALEDRDGALIVPNSDPIECAFPAIEIDALALKKASKAGTLKALERIPALYAGELLEGLHLRSAAFEEWLSIERRHYRNLAIDALGKLMAQQASVGALDAAMETARRLLGLDDLREDAHRLLINEQMKRGDRWAALQQLEGCEAALESGSIAAEPETVRLFAEVRGASVTRPRVLPAVTQTELTLPDKPSVAVLAFDNLSSDPSQQDFIDGVTEDIITLLSRFRSLFVIARNSSFQYRGKTINAKQVGRELGVRYVVEGSFRRSNSRMRICAQLIDTITGVHLWADQFDRELSDLFDVQDELSQRIATTLAMRLEGHQLALATRKRPDEMQAYDYWLQGRKCLDAHTAEGFAEARGFFEKALAADATYARAYSGLAYVYNMMPFYAEWGGTAPAEIHDKALLHAHKAVALGESDHVPHVVLGWCQLWRRNFREATHEFDLAAALNPNDANALAYRGFYQIYNGDPEAAVETIKLAIRLNPHRPDWYLAHLACANFMARRHEDAMETGAGVRDIWPEYSAWMAAVLAHAGRLDEARARAAAFVGNVLRIWVGDPNAGSGQYVQWMMNWNPFRRKSDTDYFLDGLRKAGLLPSAMLALLDWLLEQGPVMADLIS